MFACLVICQCFVQPRCPLRHLDQGTRDKRYATHTRPVLVGTQGISYLAKQIRNAVADYVQNNINGG
jgi:hypothetical protein